MQHEFSGLFCTLRYPGQFSFDVFFYIYFFVKAVVFFLSWGVVLEIMFFSVKIFIVNVVTYTYFIWKYSETR